jgi:hypothetical protein
MLLKLLAMLMMLQCVHSNLAPRKIDDILSLSIKPKVLYLGRKAKKNHVAYERIFLACTLFYG